MSDKGLPPVVWANLLVWLAIGLTLAWFVAAGIYHLLTH